MLQVETLKAAYGAAQVLFDVSFTVGEGEMVTLLGRNGMGKTTTISTIMGLMPAAGGRIAFDGAELGGLPPYRIARAGRGESDCHRGSALRPAALAAQGRL